MLLYGIVGAAIIWAIMCKFHLDGFADKEDVDNIRYCKVSSKDGKKLLQACAGCRGRRNTLPKSKK